MWHAVSPNERGNEQRRRSQKLAVVSSRLLSLQGKRILSESLQRKAIARSNDYQGPTQDFELLVEMIFYLKGWYSFDDLCLLISDVKVKRQRVMWSHCASWFCIFATWNVFRRIQRHVRYTWHIRDRLSMVLKECFHPEVELSALSQMSDVVCRHELCYLRTFTKTETRVDDSWPVFCRYTAA